MHRETDSESNVTASIDKEIQPLESLAWWVLLKYMEWNLARKSHWHIPLFLVAHPDFSGIPVDCGIYYKKMWHVSLKIAECDISNSMDQ